jgi:alpha,alpha-trehalase
MSAWALVYDQWKPQEQPLREALCVVGNGYFATRGAAAEVRAGGPHYPGTYLAGAYNRLKTEIAGRAIENEDLVNWPNWLFVTWRHEDGDWLDLDASTVLGFRQTLDLKRGVLEYRVRLRDQDGRTSTLHSRRLVHMRRLHVAALEWSLTPEDWSGPVVIRSEIDGSVTNCGVARYRDLDGNHVETLETGCHGEDIVWLTSRASQSRLRVTQAARNRLSVAGAEPPVTGRRLTERRRVAQEFSVTAEAGRAIRLEKIVSVYTQRDQAISEPALEARKTASRAGSFEALLHEHERGWDRLWERCDIALEGQVFTQRILRLHIFHLLQTSSMNTVNLDVGVPARGWHGEAYRGHIFWDELFIFPFLTLRIPEVTRTLLIYRHRRLGEARYAAERAGYAGAMFPWQSGSNGREESQTLHLNPRSGRWVPDDTHLQRHINGAIAYNTWRYYQATRDDEFLSFYGAEMILEIARFWASIASYNAERGRYDINGVVGPDEYHTGYPDSEEPGLRNNAYTNALAAWTLRCVPEVLRALPEDRRARLRRNLDISDDDLAHWDEIGRALFIPFHDGDVISQFEHYGELEEFDWQGCRERHGDIQRLDRILEAEGDTPNRYKASKQADVLMLFYLFSSEELGELFEYMGYDLDRESIPRTVGYYQARTSHGSTLSRVVHAWVLARSDREASWSSFEEALRSDLEDVQGGTTAEGIHLGAMAGTVDLVQRCYTGLELRDDVLWLNPALPDELVAVQFRFRYRGHTLRLRVSHEEIEISSCRDGPHPIRVGLLGDVTDLREGETRMKKLKK